MTRRQVLALLIGAAFLAVLARRLEALVASVPGPVQKLVTTGGVGQITIAWSAPSSDGGSPILGYHIWRGTEYHGAKTQVADLPSTALNYADPLPAGGTFFYNVRPYNSVGESVINAEVFGTATATGGDTQPPTAPGNLVRANTVVLTWSPSSDNVGVTGYRVFRNGTQIAQVTANTYTDSNAPTGATYAVFAVDAAGNVSPSSNSV